MHYIGEKVAKYYIAETQSKPLYSQNKPSVKYSVSMLTEMVNEIYEFLTQRMLTSE